MAGVPCLASFPVSSITREVKHPEVLPVHGRGAWTSDREIWPPRILARELEFGLVAIRKTEVVKSIGNDDFGLRTHKVVTACRPVHVPSVNCPIAYDKRIRWPEQA